MASAPRNNACSIAAFGLRAGGAWHLDQLPRGLARSSEVHDLPGSQAHVADGESTNGWFFPNGTVRAWRRVLGRLVVVADVARTVAERARQAERAYDLLAGPVAVRALKPVSHALPVPLQAGQETQRRFSNFSPLPVSQWPPSPLQAVHFLSSAIP